VRLRQYGYYGSVAVSPAPGRMVSSVPTAVVIRGMSSTEKPRGGVETRPDGTILKGRFVEDVFAEGTMRSGGWVVPYSNCHSTLPANDTGKTDWRLVDRPFSEKRQSRSARTATLQYCAGLKIIASSTPSNPSPRTCPRLIASIMARSRSLPSIDDGSYEEP